MLDLIGQGGIDIVVAGNDAAERGGVSAGTAQLKRIGDIGETSFVSVEVELLDRAGASFVSVAQSFNTTTSMGRLTLNVLLSFAQFEREVAGERIRNKLAASKRKGMLDGEQRPSGLPREGL
ncbi:hypothetical protein SCH01S_53_00590 [Sphingomonas changbaiensis NBRC 104936]|uniref:Resolvase/invertase-type recombinase catalytic domain-containing protein n=1 Tax=Sphingomonas changbaiensis NBRC 104936 TaxID=1219043 RepID=A0A0E9MTA7_9SPHN|nr:recombinase family protein [Sphingomonas changbaiensis]GAO40987.1 hypothetical protein SCH01S_53_00590 [Sphingomonas changbaiensis NBRC 104936]